MGRVLGTLEVPDTMAELVKVHGLYDRRQRASIRIWAGIAHQACCAPGETLLTVPERVVTMGMDEVGVICSQQALAA